MAKRKKQNLRTRGCIGKKKFQNQCDALGFIKSFYDEGKKGHNAYECKFCNKWHVATKKFWKYRNKE